MNIYAYIGNDPVNLNDPIGENAIAVAKFSYRAGHRYEQFITMKKY